MGYIQEIEKEVREWLGKKVDSNEKEKLEEDFIKWIKNKILESYKNGLRDARKKKKGQ